MKNMTTHTQVFIEGPLLRVDAIGGDYVIFRFENGWTPESLYVRPSQLQSFVDVIQVYLKTQGGSSVPSVP